MSDDHLYKDKVNPTVEIKPSSLKRFGVRPQSVFGKFFSYGFLGSVCLHGIEFPEGDGKMGSIEWLLLEVMGGEFI